jgi:LacI family transcriptional regulator
MMNIAATIKDVAKYTGLSTATISKFINGIQVKEKNRIVIEEAIQKLDFKVNEIARGLKTNRTMTVGVLIPSLVNIFSTSIVSYIEQVLLQHGYSTILCDYNQDCALENSKFDFLMNKNVDGIIMMPLGIEEDRVKRALEKEVPVVFIDRIVKGLENDVVLVDNLNAAYNAVEQLIIKGHKNVGIICGPQNIYTAQERLRGYIRVHEDYNMQMDESLIKLGDNEIQGGYDSVCELLGSQNPPTAVFVTNYEMTVGAIMALNERNIRIPEEISFIGFDNLQLAKVVKPNFSVVVQPIQQIGETTANILLRRLKGDNGNYPSIFRLKTDLVPGLSIADLTT